MRIYAVSLDSGMPLHGWAQTYRRRRTAQYVLPSARARARSCQQTVTLTDRYVLAVMGQPDRQAIAAAAASGQPAGGAAARLPRPRSPARRRWTVAMSTAPDVPKNDEEKALRGPFRSPAPRWSSATTCWSSAGPTSQGQGEDCYVLAFDLNNGKFRWGCYVASSGWARA